MKRKDDTYKDIARRIKHARWMTGLNQHEFAEKLCFSPHTLQSLELARLPLSHKTATRLCESLRRAGIVCTPNWLLLGQGLPPQYAAALHSHEVSTTLDALQSEDTIVRQEIATFEKLNTDAIVIRIDDDAMLPLYQPGDYIGGRRLRGLDIDTLLDKNCIVEIEPHNFIPRHFAKRPQTKMYILSALNPATTSSMPLMETDKVLSVALILWHRRLHL